MNCKTCEFDLAQSAKFCSNCGSKIVNDRLSLKGTWEEFIGPFFSWDNNFWRTFLGMFTNPKAVLEAYISGARKKYFQPFSYIVLYATLAVFFYKFFPMQSVIDYSEGFTNGMNASNNTQNVPQFDMSKFMDSMMNYYNFIVLSLLPLYALTSYLIFSKRGHNFFEHLVFNSYIQTNLGYISLILQVIMVTLLEMNFMSYAYIYFLIFIVFTLYTLKKLYLLNFNQTLFSGIKYLVLFVLLYFGIIVVLSVIFGIIYAITVLK